jgi:asparagine synthase (glutamine-hydrolysing)
VVPNQSPRFPLHRHHCPKNQHGIVPGKRLQIDLLAELLNRHRPNPRLDAVDQHNPLLAQPLIEVCLQIPTYVLLRGGRGRALALDAFGKSLPPEISRREDKGSTTAFVTELVRGSDTFISDTLLDGVLVREGILCRKELEMFLTKKHPMRIEQCWSLLSCLSAEVWARQWCLSTGRVREAA